ncbi:class I SAM-dependent methyltransferase [Odoribacter splanchnicus]|uniref:class I SAM-dependent methyltransferase n=1 Tax=Odoribacter splanchnicus TaxID=28118 RepID=UPI0034A37FC9
MMSKAIHNETDFQTRTAFQCPFCGFVGPLEMMGADRFPVLQKLQVIGAGRRAAKCPVCKSTDKERLIYTFLKDVEKLELKSDLTILHIAPENNLQLWLESVSANYIAGDAFLQNQNFIGNVQLVDIRDTVFPDNNFDYIICNHVICDIKEDKLALSEIYRILGYGGVAILQVPITKVLGTVEYENVKTKEEREIAYGYGYHERIYNDVDYSELLSSIGFNVKIRNLSKEYEGNGLNPAEDLYICRK